MTLLILTVTLVAELCLGAIALRRRARRRARERLVYVPTHVRKPFPRPSPLPRAEKPRAWDESPSTYRRSA
jgi:hypothetical protein